MNTLHIVAIINTCKIHYIIIFYGITISFVSETLFFSCAVHIPVITVSGRDANIPNTFLHLKVDILGETILAVVLPKIKRRFTAGTVAIPPLNLMSYLFLPGHILIMFFGLPKTSSLIGKCHFILDRTDFVTYAKSLELWFVYLA